MKRKNIDGVMYRGMMVDEMKRKGYIFGLWGTTMTTREILTGPRLMEGFCLHFLNNSNFRGCRVSIYGHIHNPDFTWSTVILHICGKMLTREETVRFIG